MKPTYRLAPLLSAAFALQVLVVVASVGVAPASALAQEGEAVNKVRDLNKKAVDAYENLELEEARKFLMQALEICAAEGLNRHPIKATTHLNLGVVLVGGMKQRDAGTKQFRRALEIDPQAKVPKRLSNPEIQTAFDAATKGGGAEPSEPEGPRPATPPPPPPVADPAGTLNIVHEAITEGKAGENITVSAKLEGGGRFERVVLAYRAEGATDFLARDMDKEGDAYVARIPAPMVRGASVAYYVEARGRGGQALARNGSPDSPHVVALSGDDEAGLVEDEATAPEHGVRSGERTWLSLGVGVGAGWAKGHPEVNKNYIDKNTNQAQPISFEDFATANLLHFNPELGYFVTPQILLSVAARLQLTTGASEVSFPDCKPNGVCQPASGATAVLARGTMLFEQKFGIQPFVSLAAGFGYIRYLVDISGFRLAGCGNTEGSNCFDTVAGGGLLFGPSAGAWYHLTGPVYLTGTVAALVGLPKTAFNLDVNLGLGYRL